MTRPGSRAPRRSQELIEETPIRLASGDHVVQFYDGEEDLVVLVGSYLSTAVLDGETVIAIASGDHLPHLAAAMADCGVDLETARRAGTIELLDAQETLGRFMVDGIPSPDAFDSVVGELVRQSASTGRPVRAFGEMVALLWAEGNSTGAVELERLWNDLQDRTPFALFCGYPRSLVAAGDSAESFGEVCRLHSHVLQGAPVPAGAEASWRFVASPEAARRARRFVEATISDWGMDDLLDLAVIAAGELAANAAVHAGGDFTVGLLRLADRLRLMVGDPRPRSVTPKDPPAMATGGRGLPIVAAIADDWGCELQEDGKVIWADFRTRAWESSAAG